MECPVPVEVQLAVEHADIGSLERAVTDALAQVGQTLWAALLERLAAALPRPVACPACGGRLVAHGRAPRRLVTLAGEPELRRQRYRCQACGAEQAPLDAALGLEPRVQHTLGVRERALWLVTELSDQKAVEVAAELRRWPIGRGELHRWVAEDGALEAAREAETEALLGAHPDRRGPPRRRGAVWVSADGTMVHDRATGTEVEVKIGLVFDGARRVGRNRRALTGRLLDAGRLLELLAGWAYEEAQRDPERAAKLTAVHGSVAANRPGIEHDRLVPFASSGPMEKAVDFVVARRFKARGMRWFRRGCLGPRVPTPPAPQRSVGAPLDPALQCCPTTLAHGRLTDHRRWDASVVVLEPAIRAAAEPVRPQASMACQTRARRAHPRG